MPDHAIFHHDMLTLAAILVGWWSPLIVIGILAPWAWVVTTVFDKDAARFYLPRETYNAVHLVVAVLAVALAFLLPLQIFITAPIMLAVLVLHLAVYVQVRNKDERVHPSAHWSLNPAKWALPAGEGKQKKRRTTKGIVMSFSGPGGALDAPAPETDEYIARVTLEEIFQQLVEGRGSKLNIAPIKDGSSYGVVATIDGVPTAIRQLARAEAVAVIDTLKKPAGLDPEERRRKLRSTLKFGVGDIANTDASITTSGSSQGMRLTLVVNPSQQVDRKVDDLGLQGQQREHLDELVDNAKGVVLLTAPHGHGRTTLLYAMVRAHDAYTQNIQILELDTQLNIEGVRHNVFEPTEAGAEFATTARSILRRDPDVCGITEMPDAETAQMVARADLEQTRVYLSLNHLEPIQAVQAYMKSVGDNALAADGLQGVIAIRLLRRLCQNCRIPYQPTPDVLKKLGLPPSVKNLYRTEGKVMVKDRPETCPVCGGTGFVGQVAAFAVHTLNDDERALLRDGDLQSVRASWRQRKQPSIQSAALQLVIKGETTVDELLRVMQPKQSSAAKPAEAKPQAETA